MTTTPSGAPSSTERSRRHRQRRRRGTRCIMVAVNELELSALIFKGYLPEEDRNDAQAIKAALEGVISDMAFDLQQGTKGRQRGADLLSERGSVKRVPRIREFGCNASQYSVTS